MHFAFSTSEFRNAFLRTIRQIIRESVRNMTVPASGKDNPALTKVSGAQTMTRTLSGKRRNRHNSGDLVDSESPLHAATGSSSDFRTRSRTVSRRSELNPAPVFSSCASGFILPAYSHNDPYKDAPVTIAKKRARLHFTFLALIPSNSLE